LPVFTTSCDLERITMDFRRRGSTVPRSIPSLLGNRQTVIVATTVTFIILAVASVVARFWSRQSTNAPPGWTRNFVFAAFLNRLAVDATVLHEMLSRKTKHQIIPNPYGVPPTEKTRLSSVWTGILADKLAYLSIIALYISVFTTLAMVLRVPLILESSSSLHTSRSGSSSCFKSGRCVCGTRRPRADTA